MTILHPNPHVVSKPQKQTDDLLDHISKLNRRISRAKKELAMVGSITTKNAEWTERVARILDGEPREVRDRR